MYMWLEELPGVETYANICHFICNNTSVNKNRHRWIYISACEHPPCTTRSFGALQRSSSPAAVSASRCHAIHKCHMRHVFEVGIRKRLSGVHKAKKCRKVWVETPCSRAGPHPSGWRSPGRDHLGEWGAVAKGTRARRALASRARKTVAAGCLADPGVDPSRVHGPRGIWLQRPRLAVAYCDEIRPGWAYSPSWP